MKLTLAKRIALFSIAIVCILAIPARAQSTSTWTGASDTNWNVAGNWDSGVPGAGAQYDTALFTDTYAPGGGQQTVLVNALFNLNALRITAGLNQTLTLTGAAGTGLRFGGAAPGLIMEGSSTLIYDADVYFDSAGLISNALGTLTFNSGKTFSIGTNNLTIDTTSLGALVSIHSNITGGTASLTKTGAGTLTLAGANTFAGGIFLNAGAIRVGNSAAFGTGALTLGTGVTPSEVVTLDLDAGTLNIANQIIWNNDLTISNSLDQLRTLNLTYAGAVALTAVRNFNVADLVTASLSFSLTGAGGIELRGGAAATVNFLNGNSTFTGGYTQWLRRVTIGNGAGDITLGALAAGQNYIGIGDVSVNGSAGGAGFSLVSNPGSGYATNIRGLVTVDWGAQFDSLGKTYIDGGTLAAGVNGADSRFIFRGDVHFTDAAFVNSPDLYFNASNWMSIYGSGMGAGAGNIYINSGGGVYLRPDVTNFGGVQINLTGSYLEFGNNNQIRAGTELYLGDSTELYLSGYNQTFGGLSWGSGAARIIYFDSSSSILFDGVSTGGTGNLIASDWEQDYAHMLFSNDVSAESWINNIKFDGYNWAMGVQVVANGSNYELIPTLGTPAAANTYEWTGSASYQYGSGTNSWYAPGNWDINRAPNFGAGTTLVFGENYSYSPNISLPIRVTVGNINFESTNYNYRQVILKSGTLIMDSGASDVAARISKSYNATPYIQSAMRLDSDLQLTQSSITTPSSSYSGTISGKISNGVNGAKSITVDGGAWVLANTANDFTGGVTLNKGLLQLTYSGSNNSMGKGTLTINGGALTGRNIYNKVVFGGDFNISAAASGNAQTNFYAIGDAANDEIWLNKDITIYGGYNGPAYLGYYSGLTFNQGRDLRGTGGFGIAGYWYYNLNTYANNSDFSGGYTGLAGNMYLYAQTGSSTGNIVFGEKSERENFLGIGDITLNGGNVYAYSNNSRTVDFRNGVNLNLLRGTFQVHNSAGTLALTDVNLTGSGTSGGTLAATGDVKVGMVVTSSLPNFSMANAKTMSAISGTVSLTGLGRFTKSTSLTTTTIGSSILQLGAEEFTISSGRLKFTRDNQAAGTANVTLAATGILSSEGVGNDFGKLSITGGSTIELGNNGVVTFTDLGTWSTSGVISLLNIQNISGAWNTADNLGLGNEHVYFLNNSFAADDVRLANIAFTGYTRGATIVANGDKYELVTAGLKGFEWSGAGGNNMWSTGGNWYGAAAPNAAGAIAIFRDADQSIHGKTISFGGNRTLGEIFFESTTGATIYLDATNSANTLTFDNDGSRARIYFAGASTPYIRSKIYIADEGLLVDHRAAGRQIYLTGSITGSGGILFEADASVSNRQDYYLQLSGTNSYSGGFEQNGGTVEILNNTVFGTGTYTITGSANLYTTVQNIVLNNDLLLDGNLSNYRATSSRQPITFKGGSGYITSGLKEVYTYAYNSNDTNNIFIFDSNYILSGPGGLYVRSNSPTSYNNSLVLRGQNTFSGGVTNEGKIKIASSTVTDGSGNVLSGPLGTGTLTIGGTRASNYAFLLLEDGAQHITIANPIVYDTGYYGNYYMVFGYGDYQVSNTSLQAGSLTLSSTNTLYYGSNNRSLSLATFGVKVDIQTPIAFVDGTESDVYITSMSNYMSPSYLRLSGSNSFSRNIYLQPATNNRSFTLSIANDHALGGADVYTQNSRDVTIEAYGADRILDSGLFMQSGSGTVYFTIANGAQTLAFTPSAPADNYYDYMVSGSYMPVKLDVMDGMTVILGENISYYTNSALVKSGDGELRLLSPNHTFNGVIVSGGTITTSLLPGNDMALNYGDTATGVLGTYFGKGALSLGDDTVAIINTWDDGLNTGSVYLGGDFTVDNGAILDIRGGGSLHLITDQTVSSDGSGRILIRDGGSLVKDGVNTTSVLNTRIDAPILLRNGKLSLADEYLLGDTPLLTFAGGGLQMNGYNQYIDGAISLVKDSSLDFGKTIADDYGIFGSDSLGTWDGSSLLTVYNWQGNRNVGGGTTQLNIDNYTITDEYALSNIWFVGYAPGARLVDKGGYVEIVPYTQSSRWVGYASDDWTNIANWTDSAEPDLKSASAAFGDDATVLDVILNTDKTVGSLLFDGTKDQQFTITGAGGIPAINFDLNDPDGFGIIGLANSSDAVIHAPIKLNIDLKIMNEAGADLELAGAIVEIGGARRVTKIGDGVLTLSSADTTYSGGFDLFGGTLRINADETVAGGYVTSGPLGVGSLSISDAAIEALGAARTVSNHIVFAGDFSVSGTNTLTFAYDPDATGGAASEITRTTIIDIEDAQGNLVIAAQNTVTGAGRLIKTGPGIMHLEGANTYTGGTELRRGVLAISNSLAISTGDLDFTDSGTLRIAAPGLRFENEINLIGGGTATIDTQANLATAAGSINGMGYLFKVGTGTLALTNTGRINNETYISGGQLLVTGTGSLTSSEYLHVGYDSDASLRVSGSEARIATGALFVGAHWDEEEHNVGDGRLIIENGAVVTDTNWNDSTFVGRHGRSGTVTISGTGSELVTRGMLVGYGTAGYGVVTLANGARLHHSTMDGYGYNDNIAVGYYHGTGTLLASGTGTRVEVGGMYIGVDSGTGTVIISDGAQLIHGPSPEGWYNDSIYVGAWNSGSSTGTLIVTGTGSALKTGGLRIGDDSRGYVLIENGASFEDDSGNDSFTIGTSDYGYGEMEVSGSATSFKTASLYLGAWGSGTGILTIRDGATALVTGTYDEIYIGDGDNAQGTLNIDGPGSLFTAGTTMRFANSSDASATVNVTNGGKFVTESEIYLGESSSGTGAVIVTGSGSVWETNTAHAVILGNDGEGYLTIDDGGLVTTGSIVMNANDIQAASAINLNATGTNRGVLETANINANSVNAALNFDGGVFRATADGELLSSPNPMSINVGAGGAYIDTNGHDNTMAGNILGLAATSDVHKIGSGTLTLGNGATHTTLGSVYVGAGALVLNNATTLLNDTNGVIADTTSASASVLLADDAHWGVTGTLFIGASSSGTLTLRDGATASAAVTQLGLVAGTASALDIADDSSFETGNLIVGVNGSGAVTLAAGSELTATGTLLLGASGTGILAMDAGTVLQAGKISLAATAAAGGTLAQNGGVIETSEIAKITSGANVAVLFDSGTVIAQSGNASFINGFADGEVTIGAGGLVLDTGNHAIGVNSSLGGAGALTKLGTGTLSLTVSNTYLAGTDIQEGTIIMSHTGAIGAGSANIAAGANLTINTGALTFSNTLTGEGTLHARLNSATDVFAFAATTGTAFRGTVQLGTGTFALGGQNAAVVNRNVALQLDVGNHTTIGTGTYQLRNLTIAGARLDIPATVPADIVSAAYIQTGTITVIGGGTFAVNLPAANTTPPSDQLPLLQQDQGGAFAKLASADAATGAFANIDIIDITSGNAITDPTVTNINQSGTLVATGTYDYRLTNIDASNNAGIYISYALKSVDILANRTLVLDGDEPSPAGASELSVIVSGSGNLDIAASNAITLSASNSYTGTTFVSTGTAIAGTMGALGRTANVLVSTNAALSLGAHAQTVGALNTAAGSRVDFAGATLAITDAQRTSGDIFGGYIENNTLFGSGRLVVDPSLVVVNGTQALTGTTTVVGSSTLVMNNAAAFGSGMLIELVAADDRAIYGDLAVQTGDSGYPSGVTSGTVASSFAGAGVVALRDAVMLTLTGTNGSFSGTYDIANATALTAGGTANLGAAAIVNNGTFTIANTAVETLSNALSGAGYFIKQNTGTLTIARDNSAFTGTTLVAGGALRLENLLGTGTGTVTNNAVLDLAGAGGYANNVAGTGTNIVSGAGVDITGSNTIAAWHITGAGTVSGTQNLGATAAARIDGILVAHSAAAWVWTNTLTGSGILKMDTTGNAFSFDASSGTAFSGTVQLANGTFALDGQNTRALTDATLKLDAGSHATVGTGTQNIGGLAINGGRIDFAATLPADVTSPTFIATSTFVATTGTVAINLPGMNISATIPQLPLLQQDEGGNGVQLVSSENLANVSGLELFDAAGNTPISNPQTANINQSGATVATGTYNYMLAATGSNGNGLYATYGLTAVDILENNTLVLASDTIAPPGADNFTAKISGSGNLAIDAANAITLTSTASTYTGTTFVNTGTLIAGADNALGKTEMLVTGSSTTVSLAVGAQHIGAIDTAATSTLDLAAGSILTLDNGGVSNGRLTGSGTLNLAAGTLTVNGANTGFAANTNLAAGATARLNDAAGLGSGEIRFADETSTLVLDTAASGTLRNTLVSGTAHAGHLVKTGTATVTIAHDNTGFAGGVSVQHGRLSAAHIDALGAAAVSVDDGATLEFTNVGGTMHNTVSGSGTLAIASTTGVLAIAHDNTIANTTLDTATVLLGSTGALGGSTAAVTAGSRSTLILGVNNIQLGRTTLNGGMLAFAAGAFNKATVASLAGSGILLFNVDFSKTAASGVTAANYAADYLEITQGSSGTHSIAINSNGTVQPAPAVTSIPLIRTTGGSDSAVFQLVGGKVDAGLSSFELMKGDAIDPILPDTGTWYLAQTGISSAADAILNTATVQGIDWAYSLDSLHLRMGEVRAENLRTPGKNDATTGNLWMRTRSYRLNAGNALSGESFRQYGYGITAGADKSFATEKGANLLGGFVDMGRIDRDFVNNGDGSTNSVGAGAYFTVLRNDGYYADFIAKFDRSRQEFDAKAVDLQVTSGRYTNHTTALSAEFGRRLRRTDGWWVEPSVQVALAWIDGASYDTTPQWRKIRIEIDDTMVAQYRAMVRFGRELAGGKWHPYGKIAAVAVDSDGTEVSAPELDKRMTSSYDGKRVEFGFGASYRIDEISQVYFDYEYSKAPNYDRPWAVNLGYRRLW